MITVKTIQEVRELTSSWSKQGLSVGFVPTMGYLHDGHASLIHRAQRENDKVVVSIFVNPIQFGPSEDFEKYPRDPERDSEICEQAGADVLFLPFVTEMFPSKNLAFVDIQNLGDFLCGAKRPGHFRGVCTIVAKFFNIIRPDRAYFGEKDFQQLAIVQRMTQDLSFDIQIIPCPTMRDTDGLALSSRNSYLSTAEREAARVIPQSLELARDLLKKGEKDPAEVERVIAEQLQSEPLMAVDYIEVVNAITLEPTSWIDGGVIVALAVFAGKTRLIDHLYFESGARR